MNTLYWSISGIKHDAFIACRRKPSDAGKISFSASFPEKIVSGKSHEKTAL